MKKIFFIFLGIVLLGFNSARCDVPKKILMIIAEENFRDEELFIPKNTFEQNGLIVEVASKTKNLAKGMLGGTIKPDLSLEEVNVREYCAVIFVGGVGASQYFNDEVALRIAKDAYFSDRLICAICIAPVILAEAGILKEKRATVWSSEKDALTKKGAIYTGRPVERDGKIITCSGPGFARQFAEEILIALK